MNILGVIPARGGSKRIPRKNLQAVAGISLLEWAIRYVRQVPELTAWCVSTEDEEIASIAQVHNAVVCRRPLELAADDTPMGPVLKHAGEFYGRPEYVLTIQPCSPFRSPSLAQKMIAMADEYQADVVVVGPPKTGGWMLGNVSCEGVLLGRLFSELREVTLVRPTGALYLSRWATIQHGRVMNDPLRWVLQERSWNIDTPMDLAIANELAPVWTNDLP